MGLAARPGRARPDRPQRPRDPARHRTPNAAPDRNRRLGIGVGDGGFPAGGAKCAVSLCRRRVDVLLTEPTGGPFSRGRRGPFFSCHFQSARPRRESVQNRPHCVARARPRPGSRRDRRGRSRWTWPPSSPPAVGVESEKVALDRCRLDAMIHGGSSFMAGVRGSEVSAVRRADVADAATRSQRTRRARRRDIRFVEGRRRPPDPGPAGPRSSPAGGPPRQNRRAATARPGADSRAAPAGRPRSKTNEPVLMRCRGECGSSSPTATSASRRSRIDRGGRQRHVADDQVRRRRRHPQAEEQLGTVSSSRLPTRRARRPRACTSPPSRDSRK